MKSVKLEIPNSKGNILSATLELPPNQKPSQYAIFAHCFACNGTLSAVRSITRTLSLYGFGVVRFDFTGLGNSEGDFAQSHFSANVEDIIAVSDFLEKNYAAPSLLIGHSLGGAASIVAASFLEKTKAVVTIATPSKVSFVKNLFEDIEDQDGVKTINIGGRPFQVDQNFLDDFEKTDLLALLPKLKKPLLILHSPQDEAIDFKNAEELYHAAQQPKSLVALDQADHLLNLSKDSEYAANIIGAWVQGFFKKEENKMPSLQGEQLLAHLNVKENNFTTHLQTPNHSFIADEPKSLKGDDFGPSPYEYLNAALASCTAMTVKLYAERKNWPLEEIYVYLSHAKKHSDDIEQDTQKKGYIDLITKRIHFVGRLDAIQKQRLMEIANKCPVHLTLQNEVVFDSKYTEEKF